MVPRIAQEDTELAGTFIPKGSSVVVDVFNIQHSEKVWENPDEFDPDRFDPKRASSQLSGGAMAWVPFGSGARYVIGNALRKVQQTNTEPLVIDNALA